MISRPIRIFDIAGGPRRNSFNRATLHAAATLEPKDSVLEPFDLDAIAVFNQDDEPNPPSQGIGVEATDWRANAILFVTPEAPKMTNATWRQIQRPVPVDIRPFACPVECQRSVEIRNRKNKEIIMPTITTKDGTEIYYKDWGKGQPIVFSHGWPLSADDWDTQMLFFGQRGYRVIAHDRRGHGRSSQTWDGHDMDHYADDLAALTAHLDLKDAIHVGHSTGGGEVVHYLARHGESRVAKAAIISAVPPLMLKTASNPTGQPKEVFDGLQAQLAANRAQFYYDLPAGPFYGYNRPGAKPSQGVIWNWWRQGMMGGTKAHYDGIVAFSQTDFTEDLKKITVPVLVMHSEDDQIVPYVAAGPLSAKLLRNGTMKTYKGFPHGMPTTEAETINADLLTFLKKSKQVAA